MSLEMNLWPRSVRGKKRRVTAASEEYVLPKIDRAIQSVPERMCEGPLALLSEREHQVFYYVVQGLRAKEVADTLELSPKTVYAYTWHGGNSTKHGFTVSFNFLRFPLI